MEKHEIDDDVSPEQLIPEAIEGNEEALHQLLFSAWLSHLLDDVSSRVSRQFEVDAQEVRDFGFEKVRLNIRKITNPSHKSWPDCLKSWCYAIARNRALNMIRHRTIEEGYRGSVTHEHTQRIEHGKRRVAPISPAMSQEDEIEQKERDAILSTLRRVMRESFHSLTPAAGSYTPQFSDDEGSPLSGAMLRKADEFFNAAQQERLTELMRLRRERTLSSEEGQELESLVEAELDGARLRAEAEIRWRRRKEIASILSKLTERERRITHLWVAGRSLMEIADESNIPLSSVARTIRKVSRRVEESLSDTLKEKPTYPRESPSEAEERSA